MWPFKNKRKSVLVNPSGVQFSQLDILQGQPKPKQDEWAPTTAISTLIAEPEKSGLPNKQATPDEIHAIATRFSQKRERIMARLDKTQEDGVYCAVCHIANTDIELLHMPCPQCGRELLEFGWT